MVVSVVLDGTFSISNDVHELSYTSQKYSSTVLLYSMISCLQKLRMGELKQMTRLEVLASVFLSENDELSEEETRVATLNAESVISLLDNITVDNKIDKEVMSRYFEVLTALSLGRSFVPWAGLKCMNREHVNTVLKTVAKCRQLLNSQEHFPISTALEFKLYTGLKTVQHTVMSSMMETKPIKNSILSKYILTNGINPVVTFDSSVLHTEQFRKDWIKLRKQLSLFTRQCDKIINESLDRIQRSMQSL